MVYIYYVWINFKLKFNISLLIHLFNNIHRLGIWVEGDEKHMPLSRRATVKLELEMYLYNVTVSIFIFISVFLSALNELETNA